MSATATVPGYTITGVAGIGGDGAVHRGSAADGQSVAIRLVPDAPAGLVARAHAAAEVTHPGIASVREVAEPGGGGLAVVQEFVDGPTLSTLRAARRGLSTAECAQLATELLAALQVLHAAGIVHGDVSPANVIVTPTEDGNGRPVLVDLIGGAEPDRGTRGFQAPEVDTGAAPGTAADVYSVARLSLWVAEPGGRDEVAALLAPLLAGEPGERPSAQVGQQMIDGGAPVGIRLAPAEVLASATLRENAARELTTRVRTRRPRPRRRHRARGRRRLLHRAGVAVLLTLVTGALLWLGPVRSPGAEPPKAGPESVALPTETASEGGAEAATQAPSEAATTTDTDATTDTDTNTDTELTTAVRELLATRDAALTARDAVALAEVTVPGSPLAAADAALLADLTEAGLQLRGYQTEVLDLTVLEAGGRTATVRAELHQLAHERHSGQGRAMQVPDQGPQCVQIQLERGPDSVRWRAVTNAPC